MYRQKRFIDDYYREVKQHALQEIRKQTDAYLISVDVANYSGYLVAKYGLAEIVLAEDRDMRIEKIRKMIDREHFGEVRQFEQLFVEVCLPVEPDATIPEILEMSPSTWSMREPSMEYRDGWIITQVLANEADVARAVHDLKDEVARRNTDIKTQNEQLKSNVDLWIAERKKLIENEDELLDQISQRISVPLKRKTDSSSVIPTALDVKEKVRPIFRPAGKPPLKLELQPEKFFAILELIDNSCRQFERTPSTFAKMGEEELRNVILSNLNSVFAGDAVGRSIFQKREDGHLSKL